VAIVFTAIAVNALTLFGTFEQIARLVAMFRLRGSLDLRWTHLLLGSFGIWEIVIAHGLATLFAILLCAFPALLFALVSLVILNWDVLVLIGRLPLALSPLLMAIVGLVFLVMVSSAARSVPDDPWNVLGYWLAFVAFSLAVAQIRTRSESHDFDAGFV
jgi:hypothetical protein